jgi:hypothetical protein
MISDFIIPKLKFFKVKELVFVLFEDTRYGYRAFESTHSIMVTAESRILLIEEIKKEVHNHFDGRFFGKVILREFVDEEVNLT